MENMDSWLQRALAKIHWAKIPLSVLVLLLTTGFLVLTPEGLLGKADAIGYAVCHRIEIRSYHLGERPLPLCARCTGMYLGAIAGLVFQHRFGYRCSATPARRILAIFALLALAFAVDGLNSYLTLFPALPHLYTPTNSLRLITGSGMGLVIAAMLYPAFQQSVYRQVRDEPALKTLSQVFWLLFITAFIDLLVMSQNPLLLYPLALLSAAGVLILLTMIYTLLWIIVLRRENQYNHWREYSTFLITGFGFALLQIMLIDLGRFLLTGTWDGFHIG